MEENKFKLWCKNKQEWEKDEWGILPNGEVFELWTNRPMLKENHILVRYTGQNDKNGKEIYSEDYIFDGKRIHRVHFSITPYWTGWTFGGLPNVPKYCKIIGNSYEDDLDDLEKKYLPEKESE